VAIWISEEKNRVSAGHTEHQRHDSLLQLPSSVDADCTLNGRRSRAPGACTASVSSMSPFSPPTWTSCLAQATSSTAETSAASSTWLSLPMGPHRRRLPAATFSLPPRALGIGHGTGAGADHPRGSRAGSWRRGGRQWSWRRLDLPFYAARALVTGGRASGYWWSMTVRARKKNSGAASDTWVPCAHRERRVRMADMRVRKLNSFITMGKMVFSPST
jgi:hypothetical protein